LIRLEGVSFIYRSGSQDTRALDGISLHIAGGEFVAVVGGNGSGKSTLAKHLNALLLPDEGAVLVNGHDTRQVEDLWQIRQLVGMVFQNPDNQLVASIIEEDVAFGPENLGLPPDEIRTRVDRALQAVGLSNLKQRPPHLLSEIGRAHV
jgi:energy-coupling factor transport system ATP-binding protein